MGLKTVAIRGFYNNVVKSVEARGFARVTLRSGGKITEGDFRSFLRKRGYVFQVRSLGGTPHQSEYMVAKQKVPTPV